MRLNWGAGIAIVYTVFAVATTAFAVFAMAQHVDLVSPDYYGQALEHDRRMAAESNAAALGDGLRVTVGPAGRLVTLVWSAATPEAGTGSATLYRAADERLDRSIALAPNREGEQRISLAGLAEGRWLLKLQWRSAGRNYYLEQIVIAQ
jgi:nitrogen fixation protein FixH